VDLQAASINLIENLIPVIHGTDGCISCSDISTHNSLESRHNREVIRRTEVTSWAPATDDEDDHE